MRRLGGGIAVGQDVDEQRVRAERIGGDRAALGGLVDGGDGLRDVVPHVVPRGQQHRHDDGGRRAVRTGGITHRLGENVPDLRLLHVDERLADVEPGPGDTHAVEQRAHGGLARGVVGPVGRADQGRAHALSHCSSHITSPADFGRLP